MSPTPGIVLDRIDRALGVAVAAGYITAADVPACFWKTCDKAVAKITASGGRLSFAAALDQVADELDAAAERVAGRTR